MKLIGNRKFYKRLFYLAIPIMIQNAITNFVGFLDNIMVGQLGTAPMSGVAIVNQFIFVFNLFVFGGLSGAGIFAAQFYGKGDHDGVRSTFRFKVITGCVIAVLTLAVLSCFGDNLIRLYLTADQTSSTFGFGKEYMAVILFEVIPFVLIQIYASSLRETGQTIVPMVAGIVSVFVNLIFNYILIFGKLGAPKLGVVGAAVATVIARIVECLIVMVWTHKNKEINIFIQGAYRSLHIPAALAKDILKKGSPLLFNEVLWAASIAMVNQCYSLRGLAVVAAVNIASTIANLFNVVFIAMGSAVAIMVGQHLGAGEFKEAKETAYKVIACSVMCTIGTSILMVLLSGLFPRLYNTTDEVRMIAAEMMTVSAIFMPLQALLHATYFTVRSGGRTGITFLFDSGFSWVVAIPVTYCLSHFTGLAIIPLYIAYNSLDIIKTVVGLVLLIKGVWVRNIVAD